MVEKAKGDVHLETVEEAEDEVQNLQSWARRKRSIESLCNKLKTRTGRVL